MHGLSRPDAAGASLLPTLVGMAAMCIAKVAFRENLDRRLGAGALAILAGATLLSRHGHASFQAGAILVAGACVCVCVCRGIENNLPCKLSFTDPVQIAMVEGLVSGVVNLTLALASGARLPPPATVIAAVGVCFLGYVVSLALFVLGLRHLGAGRTGAYFLLARLSAQRWRCRCLVTGHSFWQRRTRVAACPWCYRREVFAFDGEKIAPSPAPSPVARDPRPRCGRQQHRLARSGTS